MSQETPAGSAELYAAALSRHQEGKLEQAQALCERILERDPEHPHALHLMGVNAYRGGRNDLAAQLLRRAIGRIPGNAEFHNNLGAVLFAQNELQQASSSYETALSLKPDYAEAHSNLGKVLQARNDLQGAARRYETALRFKPDFIEAHNHLGTVLQAQGDLSGAARCYEAALRLNPEFVEALSNLGVVQQALGNQQEAIRLFEAALQRQPEREIFRANLQRARSRSLPAWHFAMMNDDKRNLAYSAAIRSAVKPGSTVLDIGTGSGLLAMLAAQAGAQSVIACEAAPLLARKAEEIIRHNGLSERIRVLAKRSTAIAAAEMPRKADVLVTEIFDSQILGEGVIPTLEHAHANLLVENAVIVPMGARILATLVESESLFEALRVGRVCGFDLSPFNDFASTGFTAVNVKQMELTQLSDSHRVFDFDFRHKAFPAEERRMAFPVTREGTCHAVLFWFELRLDAETVYTNSPFSPGSFNLHWGQCVQPLNTPLRVRAEQSLVVTASHDRTRVSFNVQGQ